nr:Gfo/Idh/MocA family oxidoreductase [Candidatus Sigynarchaeum springense]MDO8119665.1 Gfo/Idh/MocA family oxidoreductase [Candidatus Sigynarchaeota archaeon]
MPKPASGKKVLRAGLIGAGSSATNIAATIATIDEIKLVAVADVNKEAAQKIADQHEVEFVTTDYKELCTQNVDFVVISLPHGLHREVTVHCLDAGKHVLVEKPIATTVEDAQEMIATAKRNNRKLGVHFQQRFIDATREAKKIIDGGKIGKILQASVSVMWFRDMDYYKRSSWRGTWRMEGGGSLINQAIHPVDQMVFLLGDVKRLFGCWAHRVHDIEVDDNTCAAFVFESGAFGTIQTSTSTKAAFPARLTIFGSDGGIELDGNVLTFFKADGTKERTDYAAREGGQVASATDPKKFSVVAHARLMNDFADAIREDREPLVNGVEGLRALKVVRAVYDSAGEKVINIK